MCEGMRTVSLMQLLAWKVKHRGGTHQSSAALLTSKGRIAQISGWINSIEVIVGKCQPVLIYQHVSVGRSTKKSTGVPNKVDGEYTFSHTYTQLLYMCSYCHLAIGAIYIYSTLPLFHLKSCVFAGRELLVWLVQWLSFLISSDCCVSLRYSLSCSNQTNESISSCLIFPLLFIKMNFKFRLSFFASRFATLS